MMVFMTPPFEHHPVRGRKRCQLEMELALHRMLLPALHLRGGNAVAELVAQLGQALLGLEVGLRLRRVGIHDQVEAAREVVDDRQFLALQQHDVRRVQAARLLGLGQARLDVADGVIAIKENRNAIAPKPIIKRNPQ